MTIVERYVHRQLPAVYEFVGSLFGYNNPHKSQIMIGENAFINPDFVVEGAAIQYIDESSLIFISLRFFLHTVAVIEKEKREGNWFTKEEIEKIFGASLAEEYAHFLYETKHSFRELRDGLAKRWQTSRDMPSLLTLLALDARDEAVGDFVRASYARHVGNAEIEELFSTY